MKKITITFAVILHVCLTYAQQQGTITYERKVNMHRRATDEQMKAMLPEFRTSKHELVFNGSISVYRPAREVETPDPFEQDNGGGPRMMLRTGPGADAIIYRNSATKVIREQTEFADRKYIIDDTINSQRWKLAGESKTILGQPCKKAAMKTPTGNDVSAWYAELITETAGPENFGGLPGAILALDINNGEDVYTATRVTTQADPKVLVEPKTGKHISRADFRKKVEEVLGPSGTAPRIIRM